MKNINPQTHKPQWTPGRLNTRKNTPKPILAVKLLKNKHKKKIQKEDIWEHYNKMKTRR